MMKSHYFVALLFGGLICSGPAHSQVERVNPIDGVRYIQIPSGTFNMGCSPKDTECFMDEKPPRVVTISNGYWISQTKITIDHHPESPSMGIKQHRSIRSATLVAARKLTTLPEAAG
jgi:hypothetical protein